ncbi:MAG: hypothetical protein DWQ02_17610, partial [Bacteroidetes bacterium]
FKFFEHPEQKDNEIVTVQKDNYDRIWFSDLSNQLFFIERDTVYQFGNDKLSSEFNLSSYVLFQDHLILKSISPLEHSDSTLVKIIPLWNDLTRIESDSLSNYYLPGVHSACINRAGSKYLYTYSPDFSFQNGLHSANKKITAAPFDPLIRELEKTMYMPYNSTSGSILEYNKNLIAKFNNTFCLASRDSSNTQIFTLPYAINQQYIFGDQLWLLTKNGLRIFDLKNSMELKEVLFNEYNLTNLLIDKEGNYWFGTDKKGMLIVPSFQIKKFEGITNGKTVHFLSSNSLSKTLNIGHADGLFKQIDFSTGRPVESTIQLPKKLGKINKYIKRDQHYFATDIGLVLKKSLDEKVPLYTMAAASVKDFIFDRKGSLWLADSYSVFRIRATEILIDSDFKILPDHRVLHQRTYALHEDFEGTVWLGSTGGLFSWEKDTLKPFHYQEEHLNYSITDIIQTPDSTLWVATSSEGLLTIKNGQIINHYTATGSFPDNRCNKLFFDGGNYVWVATPEGLVSINFEEGAISKYDIYDGLPSNDILCMTILDSIVWAGTSKGLVSFPVDIDNHNQIAPPIFITNFAIHEQDTSIAHSYKLKHDQNSMQINFLGLNYRSRGKILYEYQMIGIDSTWVTTETRYARFPGLRPGDYTFNVVAINEDGVKSSSPASINIIISPPWWSTWWFLTLMSVLVIGTVWFAISIRIRNIRRQDKLIRQVNELSLKALQTQMNPHFIFNSLNAIQHFLTTNDQEKAMHYLSKFARLIRIVFEQSKKNLISLQEEIDFLKVYLSLEDLRFNNTIDISFELSEEVKNHLSFYQLPPLLIQPIIENAFKHGLFHKKEDKKLVIHFEKYHQFLKCTITDNGVGMKYTQKLDNWRAKPHKSSGLKATKERLSLLHRNDPEFNESDTFFKISDLYNNGKAAGTKVELII